MAQLTNKKLQLAITLVHGTWARRAEWTQRGSALTKHLERKIAAGWMEEVEITWSTVDWSGLNRMKHRSEGARRLLNHMLEFVGGYPGHAHFIIGHSHGGSVAIEALHDKEVGLGTRLFGVVCMNTPFLVALPRSAAQTLPALLGVAFSALAISGFLSLAFVSAEQVLGGILVAAALLGMVLLVVRWGPARWRVPLYRQYVRHYKRFHDTYLGGHLDEPPVLCVWTADDEATTGLQAVETLVNLPRLVFHPYAIAAVLATLTILRLAAGAPWTPWIPETVPALPWASYLSLALEVLAVFAATIFGLLALAFVVSGIRTVALGTWMRRWWMMDLFARFTVSLVPLRHSDAEFRAVEDLSPGGFTLKHSRIYSDELALDAIAGWILKTFHRREPIIFRRMMAHIVDRIFFDFNPLAIDEFSRRLLEKVPGSDDGLVQETLNQLKAVEFLTVEQDGGQAWVTIHRDKRRRL